MYRGHTVGVVVPAYNEEAFVGKTVESIPDFVDRIYVVDDGSTDGTWPEISAVEARENERRDRLPPGTLAFDAVVVPIAHEVNRGVGGAIKTGYQRARDEDVDVVAVMGADDQMDPRVLDLVLDPIVDGYADYAKGNRFLGRLDRGSMPAHRFVGNAVLSALTKVASGYWDIGDPQCGYTAISARALATADVDEMYEFYGYCNDLLVKLNVAGLRVVDVPCPIRYGDEESHIRYRTYVPRVSWMLLRNFLWRLRTNYVVFDFHPLVLAYGAGAVATTAGLLGFVTALPGVGAAGSLAVQGALSLLLLLVGVLSFVAAMVMDAGENDHLDAVLVPGAPPSPERLPTGVVAAGPGTETVEGSGGETVGGDATEPDEQPVVPRPGAGTVAGNGDGSTGQTDATADGHDVATNGGGRHVEHSTGDPDPEGDESSP